MINWNFLLQIIFYYLLLTLFIYFISDFAIFPSPTVSYQNNIIPHSIEITTQDGKKISAVYLENKQAFYTILYSHGNAEDLSLLLPFFETFRSQGFSIFAYDYHGYGKSEGRPSEKNTYLDINAAFNYLTQNLKISPDRIILYGRSLGTGPTVELASKTHPAGIILESPMVSAFRVVTILPLFPIDKYENTQKISKISSPILFIHGTADTTIPIWHGKKLYDLAREPKFFYSVENANHNDLVEIAGEQYWKTIIEFSNSLYIKNN